MVDFSEVLKEERLPRTAIVDLTADDLAALPTTPKILIPAPGEDAILHVVSGGMLLRYGDQPAAGTVRVEYEGGGIPVSMDVEMAQELDMVFFLPPLPEIYPLSSYAMADMANKDLRLIALTPLIVPNGCRLRINILYRLLGLWI